MKIITIYQFTTVNAIASWLAEKVAVSIRLLLALLSLWFRFFNSHVKAFIFLCT